MKKLIAVLLVICILGSAAAMLSGCSKKINSGTEAAKLLLANERFDEKLLGGRIDVGFSSSENVSAAVTHGNSQGFTELSTSFAANTVTLGSGYTWTDFPAASSSVTEFSQFMMSIEHQVKGVAEEIANMKNKVGITDKWVSVGREQHLLRVFEDRDVLIVRDMYDDIHVYYRYTDENAKNVYEMFSFMTYDDDTTAEIRTLFIPGERYEYMFKPSNGSGDYFIAEKSRGYWVNTRFGYIEDPGYKSATFYPYIIKDGLGFGAAMDISSNLGGVQNLYYNVFDPNAGRELVRVTDYEDFDVFSLYFSAIKNGFVSVSAENVRVDGDVYETGELTTLTTSKGTYTVGSSDEIGEFGFGGGYVQYFYGEEIYYGYADFRIDSGLTPIDGVCENFFDYASTIGLELYCDVDTVSRSIEHAALFSDTFSDGFYWNGYRMDSVENVAAAQGVLYGQYAAARADYEAVKDSPKASGRQTLSSDAHFAALTVNAGGDNSFAGGKVTVSGISVMTSDVDLFEAGAEYILKVGLALLDENGDPSAVNTVALKGGDATAVAFESGSIALSVSGEFVIPTNLDAGTYVAVVYAATKDGGIRVSEMSKIAFVTIEEGEIQSAEMLVEAISDNGNLKVKYSIKNIHTFTVTAEKAEYSYGEIERLINIEILTYGAPYHGATLQYGDGSEVPEGETLTAGNYRMICYIATESGLVQSYVYLELK